MSPVLASAPAGVQPATASRRPHFSRLKDEADAFREQIHRQKRELQVDFPWYPYDTLANFVHIDPLVTAECDYLFEPRKKIADIGAADGDMGFYLESFGHECHLYDYGPTNMNGLRGAAALKSALNSTVEIYECDLDSQFTFSAGYDLIFFLGILYHLKNPFFALERLSSCSRHLLLSTRVASHFRSGSGDVSDVPAAYLLGPEESNNDATNYWIFTEAGLKRLVDRAGWDLIAYRTVGETVRSNPQDNNRDERAFAILRSRRV